MLKIVDQANMTCYRNLSQNYEAEFSVLTGKRPDENGLYTITEIDKNHIGYLYYVDQAVPAGFVVVDIGRARYDIAEFYVIPTERRKGIGEKMAHEIFDMYSGQWQVRQIEGADKAHSFWVSVIDRYTGGAFTNTVEEDSEWGMVRIQKFNSGI